MIHVPKIKMLHCINPIKKNANQNRIDCNPTELVEFELIILPLKIPHRLTSLRSICFFILISQCRCVNTCGSSIFLIRNNDYERVIPYLHKPLYTYFICNITYPFRNAHLYFVECLFSHKYLHNCLFFYFAIFD